MGGIKLKVEGDEGGFGLGEHWRLRAFCGWRGGLGWKRLLDLVLEEH